jgi:cytochrome b subunit of formate dehydrogenase
MAKKTPKEECERVCAPIRLIRFGRFCAWALVVMVILYFISGFGIINPRMIESFTFGLLGRGAAFRLHEWLTLPMAFAFLCHALIAMRFAMIRWKVKNMKLVDYSLITLGVVLFALTAYAYWA